MQIRAWSTNTSSYSNPWAPNLTLYPFLELEVGSAFRIATFRNYTLVNPQVGSPQDLGVRQLIYRNKYEYANNGPQVLDWKW
jgi:hypothetical protein